jgi:hypothetical protein
VQAQGNADTDQRVFNGFQFKITVIGDVTGYSRGIFIRKRLPSRAAM